MSESPERDQRHRERMQRKKEVVDQKIAQAPDERGVLLVLTGNGKGKSSSGFGMAARALGHGLRVGIVQFIKGARSTGEETFFRRFPDEVRYHVMGAGFTWETQDRQDDIAKASKFAAEKFASAMLPVKDSLEAALGTENQTLEKLREGVELTLKQLVSAFDGANLVEENPLNQKFDPNKHQAIGALESDAEPNTVINVLQKGYLLHDRVVRPALVMVAKAKAQ